MPSPAVKLDAGLDNRDLISSVFPSTCCSGATTGFRASLMDGDRLRYLECLAQALTHFDNALHAYVFEQRCAPTSGAVARLMHTFARNIPVGRLAEVLSADAFERFEDAGVFDRTAGEAYRKAILAVGSSRPALESFVEFRGREPKPDALLRSYGLVA